MKEKESVMEDTVPFKPTVGNNAYPYAILFVLNNSGPGKIRGNNFIVPWIPRDRNHYEPTNKPSAKHCTCPDIDDSTNYWYDMIKSKPVISH